MVLGSHKVCTRYPKGDGNVDKGGDGEVILVDHPGRILNAPNGKVRTIPHSGVEVVVVFVEDVVTVVVVDELVVVVVV